MKREKVLRGIDGRPVFDESEIHLIWCVDGYHYAMHGINMSYSDDLPQDYKECITTNDSKINASEIEKILSEQLNKDIELVAIFEGKLGEFCSRYLFQWRNK